MLAITLRGALPAKQVLRLIPRTYILSDPEDVRDLATKPASDTVYIFKSNLQRQQGLHITKRPAEILVRKDTLPYVVCQEVLQDPLVIKGRKANMRVYLLLIYNRHGGLTCYASQEGFMYYTESDFKPYSTN
eukprot:jgi/Chrzof1/6278/UNPLg00858.t1